METTMNSSISSCPSAAACDTEPPSPEPVRVSALPLRRRSTSGQHEASETIMNDEGMATAEYAVATLAAVAFGGLLMAVVKSDAVRGFLTSLFERALNT